MIARTVLAAVAASSAVLAPAASASPADDAVACVKAWGDRPMGPTYPIVEYDGRVVVHSDRAASYTQYETTRAAYLAICLAGGWSTGPTCVDGLRQWDVRGNPAHYATVGPDGVTVYEDNVVAAAGAVAGEVVDFVGCATS